MHKQEKPINWNILDRLIDQGYNCKQLAEYFDLSVGLFGLKAKKKLGIYCSQYIAKRKNEFYG